MTTGFEQQQAPRFGFIRPAPKPQQIGRRLDASAREAEEAVQARAAEPRAFIVLRG